MNRNWFLFSDLGIICPGPASAAPTVAAPAGAAPWEAFGGGAEPKRGGPKYRGSMETNRNIYLYDCMTRLH